MKKTYLCCKTEYTICHNCNICLHVTSASSGPLCIHSSFTLVKSKLQDEKEQQLLYWHLNVENQYHSNEILAASNFFLLPLYVQLQEKTPEHKTFHLAQV